MKDKSYWTNKVSQLTSLLAVCKPENRENIRHALKLAERRAESRI